VSVPLRAPSAQDLQPSRRVSQPSAAKRVAIWMIRIFVGVGLLIVFKMAIDLVSSDYYEDVVPRVRAWPRVFLHIASSTAEARVAVFIILVWGFFFCTAGMLVYEFFVTLSASSAPRKRFAPYVWLRRLVLTATGLGLLCVVYAFYVEPYWLQVTHVRVESEKLPSAAAPIRLAVISDLHMGGKLILEPRLPGVIAAEKPDLIFFLGDALNGVWPIGHFKQLMLTLHGIAPVIVVRGNQDHGNWFEDVYRGTEVTELRTAAKSVNIRGVELYIWGQDDEPLQLLPLQPPPPPGAFTILLHHRPDLIEDAVRAHFDLYLAGHTHGGQVALPFYGALITRSRYDKKYESGLFHEGSTTLYVNRGIGFAHQPQPAARFFARPEVTVIDLVGK
jgi:predicted MPP superfamily phosphohydrolase